jgi:raffinose/stachyose/melibiose transport system permease protein
VGKIGRYLVNSAVVSGATLLIVLATALSLSYAIVRATSGFGKLALGLFSVTLFLPMQLLIIPLFELEVRLGLIDTYWGLILPYSAGTLPFAVVFGVTYLRTLPIELFEAALLDGCHHGQIFARIVVPLARPAIATIVVMTFLNIWNEFVLSLTLTQSDTVRTIPVGLLNFTNQFGLTNYPTMFAALVVATVPIVAVFLLVQRQFVRGLVDGAVRG